MINMDLSTFDSALVSSSQLNAVKSCRGKKVKFSEGKETFNLREITQRVREVFTSSDTNPSKDVNQLKKETETMEQLINRFKELDENCGVGCWKKVSRACARKHRVKDDIGVMESVFWKTKSLLGEEIVSGDKVLMERVQQEINSGTLALEEINSGAKLRQVVLEEDSQSSSRHK